MITAGKGPAERDLQLGDGASCRSDQSCLFTDKATGTMGVQAGFFQAPAGCPAGCGGAGCYVFLYQQVGSWHYVNAMCVQAPGLVPGPESLVYVSGGCANVRATPGTSGKVVACLPDQTHVSVEGGPLYADGKIWWHLKDRGWMAHDFLVAPKGS